MKIKEVDIVDFHNCTFFYGKLFKVFIAIHCMGTHVFHFCRLNGKFIRISMEDYDDIFYKDDSKIYNQLFNKTISENELNDLCKILEEKMLFS